MKRYAVLYRRDPRQMEKGDGAEEVDGELLRCSRDIAGLGCSRSGPGSSAEVIARAVRRSAGHVFELPEAVLPITGQSYRVVKARTCQQEEAQRKIVAVGSAGNSLTAGLIRGNPPSSQREIAHFRNATPGCQCRSVIKSTILFGE
jgi:hypothetical protein